MSLTRGMIDIIDANIYDIISAPILKITNY